ncbi:MAG: hypothetical protein E6I60_05570 [Chloroflexi bacterium]|nr:MAG: hypothetical protein E6I60_05570 [Chloroflexota bacterium]
MADDHLTLPSIAVRHWIGGSVGVVILIAFLALVVGQHGFRPHLTREQAIATALKYGSGQAYPRVEAKYMRGSDLAKGNDSWAGADPQEFVWVVAISGHYGISPLGTTTWGIAVVRDEFWSATSPVFEGGIEGNWPPFFDDLPDLTQDQK